MQDSITYSCCFCEKSFKFKGNLQRHAKTVHQISGPSRNRNTILCPNSTCSAKFCSRKKLREHLMSLHNVNIELVEERLSSYKDFLKWKERIEKETKNSYVCNQSTKLSASGEKKIYFTCHRSGNYSCKSEGKRASKKIGSKKINAWCPSSIDVIEYDREVKVKYWKTHYGHENELKHLFLSKYLKADIASLSSMQFPFSVNTVVSQSYRKNPLHKTFPPA